MTIEEKILAYMKLSKKELAELLAEKDERDIMQKIIESRKSDFQSCPKGTILCYACEGTGATYDTFPAGCLI